METPLVIMSVLVVVIIYGVILNNLRTGKYDLLSWRNVFIMGFAQFYGFGTYYTITLRYGSDIYVAGPEGLLKLFLAIPFFLILLAICFKIGERWKNFGKYIPALRLPVTDPGIVIATLLLVAAGIVASALPMVSYLNVLIVQIRGGMAGTAAGLATYYLIARKFNPIAWMLFGLVVVSAMLVGMVGETGRRGLLGVLMGIAWMWWYYALRHNSLGSKMVKLGSIGAVTFVFIMLYASFRGEGGNTSADGGFSLSMRAQQITEFAKNPMIQKNAILNMMGSDAPTDTMFIMENYPNSFEYQYFNGALFFLSNPIPRYLWPGKPIGMGKMVQEQLGTPANLGVGILGHGWAEGGWFGIATYAIFFGILIGALDRLIRERSWNPYFVAAIGANLGNVFGLARGETSLFLLLVVSGFIGAVVVLYGAKMVFGPIMASGAPLLTIANQWILDPEGAEQHEQTSIDLDDAEYAELRQEYSRAT